MGANVGSFSNIQPVGSRNEKYWFVIDDRLPFLRILQVNQGISVGTIKCQVRWIKCMYIFKATEKNLITTKGNKDSGSLIVTTIRQLPFPMKQVSCESEKKEKVAIIYNFAFFSTIFVVSPLPFYIFINHNSNDLLVQMSITNNFGANSIQFTHLRAQSNIANHGLIKLYSALSSFGVKLGSDNYIN
uniref:Uncharacterized protein n=1 Tax=Tetranychus urticae TaxID=32264 RepID=T1L3G5_TETUR